MIRKPEKIRVLLADDHEVVRRGAREVLQRHSGLQIVGEAANGREAVEKAKKLKPNVAIVDIEMPELGGLAATHEILEAVPNTNVLVFTIHESDEMIRQVLEAGARGFVLKSDLAYCLLKAVKAVSRGELSLSPRVSQIVVNGFLNARKKSMLGDDSRVCQARREVETIRLLASGKSNKEVASSLGIKVKTAASYRERIMMKLNLHSVAELVLYAVRNKLIQA